MKKLFIVITLFSIATLAQQKEEVQCKKNSDCEIVRVLTRCDVEKQKLRNKIAVLEKEVKELQSDNATLVLTQHQPTRVETRVIRQTVEKEVVRHNILSINIGPDVTGSSTSYSGNSATSTTNYGYTPGLMYQYQFDVGLTPGVGLNANGHPSAYLGWGF